MESNEAVVDDDCGDATHDSICVYVRAIVCKPDGAVEINMPSGPAGGTDQTARLIRKILQERRFLDVPVSVVNKPGADGAAALAYLK